MPGGTHVIELWGLSVAEDHGHDARRAEHVSAGAADDSTPQTLDARRGYDRAGTARAVFAEAVTGRKDGR